MEHGHDGAFQGFNGDAVSIHGNVEAAEEGAEKVARDDKGKRVGETTGPTKARQNRTPVTSTTRNCRNG
jgi:hypothetical protein